ncbi:MAG: NAD-dependent isocitrate dehydrogenase [Blastocatellia bacterium]|nr:NAD-dependent isocitrate dehydrogenase [Blastocatellia bacterium]
MKNRTVTLLKGDGIGPEISDAVLEIFEAAKAPITWEEAEAGLSCVEKYGNGLPQETLESIRRNQIALKGPTTTPIAGGHKSVNVTIRKSLDLFANVRPAKTLPGVKTRFDNVDVILVRENIEDTYGGIEHWQTPDVVQCLKIITRPGSMAVIRYAFEMATAMGRQRVTCVHKANIHKYSDGLFLDCFREVAKEYPHLQADDILIDNACMQLVTKPEQFDVMITQNLYGDIVSDLCAGLVGGLGVAPAGNIGRDRAVFEAVHGSAPDIAGMGVANPTALLQSATLMLYYLRLPSFAKRIERALHSVLADGLKTRDLGGKATTRDFTQAIIHALPPFGSFETSELASPAVMTCEPEAAHVSDREWVLRGADVFIQHEGMPEVPQRVGKMELSLISNRGTKIYPGPRPDIYLVDWFRLRYKATEPLTQTDIDLLLAEISKRFTWMHVEKLHEENGVAMFSKAQGE